MDFDVVQILQQALWLVLMMTAPPVAVAVVFGLLLSFLQAVTQIQEQTIQFAVKLVSIVLTLFLTADLIGHSIYRFADRMFTGFSGMVGG